MPLSDEELRLLEQMERALQAEDPKFAANLRGHSLLQSARRRLVFGIVAFVVGIVALVGGVVLFSGGSIAQTVVGVVGFVLMLAGVMVGISARKDLPVVEATSPRSGMRPNDAGKARRKGSLMQRFEARWERRRNGYNF